MAHLKNFLFLARTLRRQPRMLRVSPALNLFFLRYIGNFQIKNSAGHWTVHSHLPPLNHRAFGRFIDDHLLKRIAGPSHAQVGLTNDCPQACAYCYNRDRRGRSMDTETILRAVRELKEMGVCWLGLTGGEPLLNPDIARIVASVVRRLRRQAVHHRQHPDPGKGAGAAPGRAFFGFGQPGPLAAGDPRPQPRPRRSVRHRPRGHRHLQKNGRHPGRRLGGDRQGDDPPRPGGGIPGIPAGAGHR